MEPSKPPKDILELGRYLVRELEFEDGVDTLGRWMAHHVAELIDRAENAPTETERLAARRDATETILKIWEHRASLPGGAYPLKAYQDAIGFLERLQPDRNPFVYFRRRHPESKDQIAADLFDSFSRLVIALLIMEIQSSAEFQTPEAAAIESLGEAEQHILRSLQQWSQMLIPVDQQLFSVEETESDPAEVNLNEAGVRIIDRISADLMLLREEIAGAFQDSTIQ